MGRLIQNLQIKNFKSIRDLSLDCERINLFIGKPNAGKSNILEAISLLGAKYTRGESSFMQGFIRYNSITQLFNNYNFREPIEVKANDALAVLRPTSHGQTDFNFSISSPPPDETSNWSKFFSSLDIGLLTNGRISNFGFNDGLSSIVKKYNFRPFGEFKENELFLLPPYGDNFYFIARSFQEIREEIQEFLKPNGLELLLDEESKRLMILQREAASLISFPLHLIPDTFQRYIFHLAAIFSNQDSVLLFEEPETHSYAPYVYQLAQHILQDERNNQYFITTHNPYFLLPILQETKDVAVFMTWFENYQTHCRKLSEEEIREALDHGMDIFLNLDSLVPA
ncbi:MAG: AAA family ATPase [Lewinellaceae bacterium]|nr:AAA family ATPase [Lewinellaceae bacterium]